MQENTKILGGKINALSLEGEGSGEGKYPQRRTGAPLAT